MEIVLTDRSSAPARLIACFSEQKPATDGLEANLARIVQDEAAREEFSKKFGSTLVLTPGGDSPRHIILMGLGKAEEFNPEKARRAAGKALKQAQKLKAAQLDINLADFGDAIPSRELGRVISEGALLAAYKFDKYITERKDNPVQQVNLLGQGDDLSQGIDTGKVLAEATNLARALVDEPANVLTPAKLAFEAEKAGAKYGFAVNVRDEAGIRALGMEAFLMVAKASYNPPRLIVMEHKGN